MQIMFVTKAGIGEKLVAKWFGEEVHDIMFTLDVDLETVSPLMAYGKSLVERRKEDFGAGHVIVLYGLIISLAEDKGTLDDILASRVVRMVMEELPELRTVLDGVRARVHLKVGTHKYHLDLHHVVTRLDRILSVCVDYAEKRVDEKLASQTIKEFLAELKDFVKSGSTTD